jgi:hypothetical protein
MRLIGFNGGMGSGKSTALEIIKSDCARKIVLVKFAQPLYDMQEYIYACIDSVITRGPDFVKDRKLLQWLGTDWGRGLDKDLWIKIWEARVQEALNFYPDAIIVCDDVRFDNEAEIFKKLGGTIIKINSIRATERINTANGLTNHPSEAGIKLDYVDYVIENNGTLEEYKDSLSNLYREAELLK